METAAELRQAHEAVHRAKAETLAAEQRAKDKARADALEQQTKTNSKLAAQRLRDAINVFFKEYKAGNTEYERPHGEFYVPVYECRIKHIQKPDAEALEQWLAGQKWRIVAIGNTWGTTARVVLVMVA